MKKGTSAPSVAPLARPVQAPKPVQREQRAGRVGAAAAQSGAPGQLLVHRDVHAQRRAGLRLQRACGAQAQVVGRQRRPQIVACQGAVLAQLEVQPVAPVDELEHRLQQVVAIGAAPHHMKEQVQLGRRRPS
jgi:hypothetical protein